VKKGKISLQIIDDEQIDEQVHNPRQACISTSKKLISNLTLDGESLPKKKPIIPALNLA
jgi:hypothetical protein